MYPLNERASLTVGRFVYDVVDCSERGLRYAVKNRRVPAVGAAVGGVLSLRRGGVLEITGKVLRTRGATVALELDEPGIPFGDIIGEQRYLRGRGFSLRE